MLTFKNEKEEEFWRQVFLLYVTQAGHWEAARLADKSLTDFRVRQPAQQFPEIKE